MAVRRCGSTGPELPVLGVGCWSFGGGSYWGAQDQRDVDGVVAAALDLGCAFFDTAEGYNEGRSEEALGRALAGRRGSAIIASKISPDHCAGGLLRRHLEATLARLGTDYVDLYLVHWPVGEPAILAHALAEMDVLRREGKIRHAGVSNFGVRQIAEAAALGFPVVANELPYSLLARAIEWEVLPACERLGIGILGYMPLMQGLLSGRYRAADELPPARTRTRHFRGDRPGSRHGEPGRERETFEAVAAIRAIAEREGMPMEQLAIAWSISRPSIACTIVGARNAAQLEANARAAEIRLAPGLMAELDAATDELKNALGRSVDLFQGSAGSRTR